MKIYTFVINFLVSILVVKLLGSEGKGDLALLTNFYTLLGSFAFLSLGSGFIYYNRKPDEEDAFVSTFLNYALVLIILLLSGGIIFSSPIMDTFFPQIDKELYFLSFSFLFIVMMSKINEGLTRGFYSAKAFNTAIFIERTIYILGLILLLFLKVENIKYVVGLLLMSSIFAFAFILFRFWNKISIKAPSISAFRKLVKFGGKEHLGVIAQKLNLRLDIVLMGMLVVSESELGYYSIAVFFVELVWFIPNAIGVFLFPKISGESNSDQAKDITFRLTKYTMFLSIPLVLIIYFIVPMLIPILYGGEFVNSISPLRILIFGTFLMIPCKVISKFFAGTGVPQFNSYMAIIGLVFNIALLYYLVPTFGIVGAAISSMVSYIIMSIFMVNMFVFREASLWDLKRFFVFDIEDKNRLVSTYQKISKIIG